MSDVIITPLMNLPNPVPGSDPGPDYANNISNSLNIIDQHNHTVGSGNQINTAAIDINADLPFNSNYNATQLRSVRFTSQGSPIAGATDLGCLYESGVDLYYNDGNGNQVKITSGGSVNATSSGISSGTATASFSGGVLVVDSNTSTPANIQAGSILIGNNVASSNFVTLSAPNALASNYQLILPAIPAAQNFLSVDASGNIAAYAAVAGGITGSNIASATIATSNIANSAITTAKITNLSVTNAKLNTQNYVGSQFSATSTTTVFPSATTVTGSTVSITCTGSRGVLINVTGRDGAGHPAYLKITGPNSDAAAMLIVVKDGVDYVETQFGNTWGTPLAAPNNAYYPLGLTFYDFPTAGTHVYALQIAVVTGSSTPTASITNGIIYVTEL